MEAHILFLDLVKAFDSVNLKLLWKILKLYGIPDSLIIILKKLHSKHMTMGMYRIKPP